MDYLSLNCFIFCFIIYVYITQWQEVKLKNVKKEIKFHEK